MARLKTRQRTAKVAVALLWVLLVATLSVVAEPPPKSAEKTAMVVEVVGDVKTDSGETIQLMQMLRVDTQLILGPASKVRLSYREGGRETLEGPGVIIVDLDTTVVVSGARQTIEDSRGTRVVVPRDENLRRMGGELQASLDAQMPELAYAEPPTDARRNVPMATAIESTDESSGPIQLYTSPAVVSSSALVLRWKGGPALFKITAAGEVKPAYRGELKGGEVAYPGPELAPGLYRIQAEGTGREVLVMSPWELGGLNPEPEMVSRSDWLVRISQLIHHGLLDEAVKVNRRAVRMLPGDDEVKLLLQRLLRLQGKFEEADQLD